MHSHAGLVIMVVLSLSSSFIIQLHANCLYLREESGVHFGKQILLVDCVRDLCRVRSRNIGHSFNNKHTHASMIMLPC